MRKPRIAGFPTGCFKASAYQKASSLILVRKAVEALAEARQELDARMAKNPLRRALSALQRVGR